MKKMFSDYHRARNEENFLLSALLEQKMLFESCLALIWPLTLLIVCGKKRMKGRSSYNDV
jgi:hypothetical protein